MNRLLLNSLCCAIVLSSAVLATAAEAPMTAQKRVILISWDGLRPEMLTAERFRTPQMRRLIQEGAASLDLRPVDPTVTYPNHTSIVTGVSPALHGILSNTVFDPEAGPTRFWYWYAKDIRVPTVWKTADDAGKKVVMLRWPATVGAELNWNIPEYFTVPGATTSSDQLLRAAVHSKFLKELEKAIDSRMPENALSLDYDEWIVQAALYMEKQYKPDLQLIHLAFADHTQHKKGIYADETLDAVKDLDRQIGKISALIASDPQLCLIILGDHGHADFKETFFVNALLQQKGFLEFDENKNIKNWQAVAHIDGPQAAVYLKKGVDPKKIQDLIRKNAPEYVQILSKDQLNKLKFHPQAAFGLVAKVGYSLSSEPNNSGGGEQLTQSIPPTQATHGYLSSENSMKTALVAVGCGIKAGQSLGALSSLQIAPTLSGWLDLKMTGFEAKPVAIQIERVTRK